MHKFILTLLNEVLKSAQPQKSVIVVCVLLNVDHMIRFQERQILFSFRNYLTHIYKEAIEILKLENNFKWREEMVIRVWLLAYKD